MPTSRPGLILNEDGICGACQWHVKKQTIDWKEREQQFYTIARWARATTKASWDCVLGVSGGKDSIWQAYMLRDKFKMNPLLVQYAAADGTIIGRKNIEALTKGGFTLLTFQPNPRIARRLAKKSFFKFGNIDKYSEYSLFSIPFRTAINYKIPLVLFGENPALEAGDKNTETAGWDATGIKFNNTLSGASLDIWKGDGIEIKDLIPYVFPSNEEIERWNGKGIFMGYFLNWSGWYNAIFAMQKGMSHIEASYDDIGIHFKHNSLDSDNGGIVNSMLKHIKFGFGNTTEFSAYDVRDGRITREEAAALIRRLDGKCHPRYIKQFCDWIRISEDEFWKVANSFRGSMWKKNRENTWYIENPIWEQLNTTKDFDTDAVINRIDTIKRSLGSEVPLEKA